MKKLFLNESLFPFILILLLAFSRFIPHPPNFTPIIAVAIMSGYFFKNINVSYIVLLISMLLVDVFIGFYKHMFFVYLSLFLITIFNSKVETSIHLRVVSCSLIFFIKNIGYIKKNIIFIP